MQCFYSLTHVLYITVYCVHHSDRCYVYNYVYEKMLHAGLSSGYERQQLNTYMYLIAVHLWVDICFYWYIDSYI